MVSKFIDYLIWPLIILVLMGLLWFLAEPIIWWTEKSEIRLCVRIFLVMFAVNTFAVLRLYNSIVNNTRFNIKLREVFMKLLPTVIGLERIMRGLNSSLSNAKSSADTLKKGVDRNTDEIEKLIFQLKRGK